MAIQAYTPQFQALTFTSNRGLLTQIVTEIGVSKPFDPNTDAPEPRPEIHSTRGLWDTGASRSVITKATARSLGLVPTSLARMTHAGGATDANVYLVNLYLPNRVMIHTIGVVEMEDTGGFGALIGMDVITLGDFALTNYNDTTVMSFRYPSIQTVDYVTEANRLMYSGTGRNAPCPCGQKHPNGTPVKFKHCHGKT